MYSKDQASQIRQAFWTAMGQYISPHLSAEGQKINWINYRTGIKHLHFKMYTGNRDAWIAIEMTHPDLDIQQLMFEQFEAYKVILNNAINEEWEWELHTTDMYGKTTSRIVKYLDEASIFRQSDWPKLISFFKPRIIALDEFWSDAKYGFDLFK